MFQDLTQHIDLSDNDVRNVCHDVLSPNRVKPALKGPFIKRNLS